VFFRAAKNVSKDELEGLKRHYLTVQPMIFILAKNNKGIKNAYRKRQALTILRNKNSSRPAFQKAAYTLANILAQEAAEQCNATDTN